MTSEEHCKGNETDPRDCPSQERPLITLAMFAYNHEQFIAEAVRGALSQTYSPLEILISDDCSTDRTFELIEAEVAGYAGPHIIRLNRNEPNIGFGPSINKVMELARGRLIVAASADDVSLPNRVERLYQAYAESNGKALSIFSNAIVIDESGNRQPGRYLRSVDPESLTASYLARRLSGVLGASHVWDRQVFDIFGPLIEKRGIAEDVIISFRSALLGEVRYIDESLVLYRLHANNAQFGHPDRLRPEEVERSLLKVGDMWVDACHQRLEDLKTALVLFPERREELLGIQRALLNCLREKQYDKTLLLTPNSLTRIGIMLRAIRQGVRLRVIARWILLFFFPSLYMGYQRKLTATALSQEVEDTGTSLRTSAGTQSGSNEDAGSLSGPQLQRDYVEMGVEVGARGQRSDSQRKS